MRSVYLSEFLMIAAAHLLAVASPGPDFALVARQSLAYGRQTAIWSSIGIGLGILVHTTYSLLGIGLLIKNSALAFTILKSCGALYLAYIGWKSLQAQAPVAGTLARDGEDAVSIGTSQPSEIPSAHSDKAMPTRQQALGMGFLTNALNPKATLFFLALFSVVISPATPTLIKAGYGLWMACTTAAWFCAVSLLFSHPSARRILQRGGHWGERIMGVILIAFSIRLLLV